MMSRVERSFEIAKKQRVLALMEQPDDNEKRAESLVGKAQDLASRQENLGLEKQGIEEKQKQIAEKDEAVLQLCQKMKQRFELMKDLESLKQSAETGSKEQKNLVKEVSSQLDEMRKELVQQMHDEISVRRSDREWYKKQVDLDNELRMLEEGEGTQPQEGNGGGIQLQEGEGRGTEPQEGEGGGTELQDGEEGGTQQLSHKELVELLKDKMKSQLVQAKVKIEQQMEPHLLASTVEEHKEAWYYRVFAACCCVNQAMINPVPINTDAVEQAEKELAEAVEQFGTEFCGALCIGFDSESHGLASVLARIFYRVSHLVQIAFGFIMILTGNCDKSCT